MSDTMTYTEIQKLLDGQSEQVLRDIFISLSHRLSNDDSMTSGLEEAADRIKRAAYWAQVRSTVEDIEAAKTNGDFSDEDEAREYIEDTCDGHGTYTTDAQDTIRYSDNSDAYVEQIGEVPMCDHDSINWTALAVYAFMADVESMLDSDFFDFSDDDADDEEDDVDNDTENDTLRETYGDDLIGKRVQVYSPSAKTATGTGTIISDHHVNPYPFLVQYDDGPTEHCNASEFWVLTAEPVATESDDDIPPYVPDDSGISNQTFRDAYGDDDTDSVMGLRVRVIASGGVGAIVEDNRTQVRPFRVKLDDSSFAGPYDANELQVVQ